MINDRHVDGECLVEEALEPMRIESTSAFTGPPRGDAAVWPGVAVRPVPLSYSHRPRMGLPCRQRSKPPMTTPKVPSEDDPAQLPVQPEFPSDDDPTNPHSDEGKAGADENAAGFVKEKL